MEEKKLVKIKRLLGLLIFFCIFFLIINIVFMIVYAFERNKEKADISRWFQQIEVANIELREKVYVFSLFNKYSYVLIDAEKKYLDGFSYYEQARISFDEENWKKAEFYCSEARKKWFGLIGELKDIKVDMALKNLSIFNTYMELMDKGVEMYHSIYEACEYFEGATRMYAIEDYKKGGEMIDKTNERIRDYDKQVFQYTEMYSKLKREVNAYIEEKV